MRKFKIILKRVIYVILVLLLLALIFGLVLKFTNAGDKITDLFDKDFRVVLAGVIYKGDDNKIALRTNEQMRFDIKGANGYKVNITPNVTDGTDFVFTVDGVYYSYSETPISKLFLTEKNCESDYFVLNALADYSIESVLSKLYDGKTVEVDTSLIGKDTLNYPYLLTVTSNDKTIQFLLCAYDVANLSLDCEHIVF